MRRGSAAILVALAACALTRPAVAEKVTLPRATVCALDYRTRLHRLELRAETSASLGSLAGDLRRVVGVNYWIGEHLGFGLEHGSGLATDHGFLPARAGAGVTRPITSTLLVARYVPAQGKLAAFDTVLPIDVNVTVGGGMSEGAPAATVGLGVNAFLFDAAIAFGIGVRDDRAFGRRRDPLLARGAEPPSPWHGAGVSAFVRLSLFLPRDMARHCHCFALWR